MPMALDRACALWVARIAIRYTRTANSNVRQNAKMPQIIKKRNIASMCVMAEELEKL